MDAPSLYEQHLRFMQKVVALEDIAEEDLLPQFDILLKCIPNGGKLYKYRSLCGRSFRYIYDSLKNGYLWLPPAKDLNDDYDSVLITDALENGISFNDCITRDKDLFFYTLFKQCGQKYWEVDDSLKDIPYNVILGIFDPVTGAIEDEKLHALFLPFEDSTRKLKHLKVLFARLLFDDYHQEIEQYNQTIFSMNRNARSFFHVYSMSENYDLGNMWGYYADSGQGFCIEYDFSRAKSLGATAMRYLLNTFKIHYTDTPQEIPMELFAELNFFDPNNPDIIKKPNMRLVMDRLLTKEQCWENEREWRIVFGSATCRIPVDIVSAVIIDERAVEKTNAKKLICLCKKRGWPVKVRESQTYNTFHSYHSYEERKNDESKELPTSARQSAADA